MPSIEERIYELEEMAMNLEMRLKSAEHSLELAAGSHPVGAKFDEVDEEISELRARLEAISRPKPAL